MTRFLIAVLGTMALVAGLGVSSAAAQNHQGGYVMQRWNVPTPIVQSVTQSVDLTTIAAGTLWELDVKFEGGSAATAWVGTDISTSTRASDFYGANVSGAMQDPWSHTCNGTKASYSCYEPVDLNQQSRVRLEVNRVVGGPDKSMWEVRVMDLNTAQSTIVEQWYLPGQPRITEVRSYVSYQGPPVACNLVPLAQGLFDRPYAIQPIGSLTPGVSAIGPCAGGASVTAVYDRFQLRVGNPAPPPPPPPPSPPAPAVTPNVVASLTSLRLQPQAFRAARRGSEIAAATRGKPRTGTTVSFQLNGPVKVQLMVVRLLPGRTHGKSCEPPRRSNRRGHRCARPMLIGKSFTYRGVAGSNRFRFTGRVGGRRLSRGQYRLYAFPNDPGHRTGGTSHVRFAITR